jgi:N4-(beta-N-acetylglucosaminyl)-L-asparaginase
MQNRRNFLQLSFLGAAGVFSSGAFAGKHKIRRPLVISTWNEGINANKAAWQVLRNSGKALDAVEAGVQVTEASQNCCVGLGAYPDRDGIVTLDACIMDEKGNCGSVGALERIRHPMSCL